MGLVNSQALPNLVQLDIEDESFLPRIVGFHEYHQALKLFDRLAAISTDTEMQAYDEVIQRRPEFSIYVGRPDTVQSRANRMVFQQSFRQSGLAWVTALARVELGAMIAAFSERENPFGQLAPTRYDVIEFQQLLAEGWSSHFLGTQQIARIHDASKSQLAPGERGTAILKIARRAKLASDMVVVAAGTMNPAASDDRFVSLQRDYDQLQEYRNQLSSQLKAEINRARGQVRSNSGWQTERIPLCARGGVEMALAAGHFSVKPLE